MNDELKRNIYMGGGVNRSNNTLDSQLFSSVSNPYTFTLDGDYNANATIIEQYKLVDLSYYAESNISNYQTVTSIPQSNLNYLQSGLYASYMNGMFADCVKLTTIPKLNINTNQCTDMSYMFYGCSSLTSLDVSNFNTNQCTDMNGMFYNCESLTSLDISNFDTNQCTDMGHMFYYCSLLVSLNLSNFNTNQCTDMSYMFYGCSSLTSLDVSNFDTNQCTDMNGMFYNCESLTSLDISNFDTSNVTNMSNMFYNCESLITITGIIDMKSCIDYTDIFGFCRKLTGVKIKNPPAGFDGAGLSSSQYTIVS